MANQPPAGRWMRMATLRPMSNPNQGPPSPQPPAPRPFLSRTFTTVPFRPAVPTVPPPVAAMPQAPVTAPPRQVTPNLPAVTAIRPAPVRLAPGTNGISSPRGATNTTSVSNGVPSPQQTYTAAARNGVPSPQQAYTEAATNGVPSPQQALNGVTTKGIVSPQRDQEAVKTNGAPSLESPLRAPAALTQTVKPTPQPAPLSATINTVSSPQRSQVAPPASPGPGQQTSPMIAGNGTKQLLSPPSSTNTTSPTSKAPYTPQFFIPKSPSQQSHQQPSVGYHSPVVSPSLQKQTASPNFTSTTSAPVPRTVTFSNVQTFSSPTKTQASPAASTPYSPPDRTPPQSPKIMSLAHPPSPLHLPPPQLRSDTEQVPKIPQEPEQKSILFQQTTEKHHIEPHTKSTPNQKSPQITKQENNTKPTTKDTHPHHKSHQDTDFLSGSIITIAGENRGAMMNLSHPHTKSTHQKFPGNPHQLQSPNGTESEQSSGSKSKPKSKESVSTAMKSFMNSNVQGINNSIMFNSIVSHHDPGVHVALSRKHKGLGRHYKEHKDGHQ